MSLPEKGIYVAKPIEWAVVEPPGKCPRFECLFECTQRQNGAAWEQARGERITGRLTLVNTDGNLNEINYRSLRDALGWDGSSPKTLNDTDWSNTEVQIGVGDRGGNDGKNYREVAYLNPKDYKGHSRIDKPDSQQIQSLEAKYGALFRAHAGKNGGAKPTASASVAPKPNGAAGKEKAWAVFVEMVDGFAKTQPDKAYTAGEKIDVFRKVVSEEIFTGRDLKQNPATDAEWEKAIETLSEKFSPAARMILPF